VPTVDTFVTEVSQDTWIYFPWDMGLAYVEPIAKDHKGWGSHGPRAGRPPPSRGDRDERRSDGPAQPHSLAAIALWRGDPDRDGAAEAAAAAVSCSWRRACGLARPRRLDAAGGRRRLRPLRDGDDGPCPRQHPAAPGCDRAGRERALRDQPQPDLFRQHPDDGRGRPRLRQSLADRDRARRRGPGPEARHRARGAPSYRGRVRRWIGRHW